jgi:nitric oxide synthase oxygenase domain/subunit
MKLFQSHCRSRSNRGSTGDYQSTVTQIGYGASGCHRVIAHADSQRCTGSLIVVTSNVDEIIHLQVTGNVHDCVRADTDVVIEQLIAGSKHDVRRLRANDAPIALRDSAAATSQCPKH